MTNEFVEPRKKEKILDAPQIAFWHWGLFGLFVVSMLVLDLMVFHRKAHEPTLRESALWTVFWCSLAVAFNCLIWFWLGTKPAVAFLVGYTVEWTLSMDNVFVFLVIFTYFGVPLRNQYRVLFWGILGAVIMRLLFITLAATLVEHFQWVMWIFGVFLVYTGIKLAMHNDEEVHPDQNIVIRMAKKVFTIAKEDHSDKFFVREEGRFAITSLFLVLLAIETTDVVFAVDSIPAIFGSVHGWIAQEDTFFTFIIFTSNVFAILGLRALYFLLAGSMGMFRYLSYGLSSVLVFVGGKMVADYWVPKLFEWPEHQHVVPPLLSLVAIFLLLGISIAASLIAEKRDQATTGKDAKEN